MARKDGEPFVWAKREPCTTEYNHLPTTEASAQGQVVVERCLVCRARRTRQPGDLWKPWRSQAEQVQHALLALAKER